MARFTGKVVIVTGSSNGIGRTTAVVFAKDGAKVTISGRNVERLEETRQEILKQGVPADSVNAVVGDITTEKGQNELIESTIKKFGKLDILVNNAGASIVDPNGKVGLHQSSEMFDKTFGLNIKSVVEILQKARPHLAATKGDVVNVSSIAAGPQAHPSMLYYGMAKAALDHFTRSTSIELIEEGIRVNSVSPGLVLTGFQTAMGLPEQLADKLVNYMVEHKECIPARVAGTPQDIANVITFLADKNLSSFIIGQTIVADGGTTLISGTATLDFASLLSQ